MSKEPFHERTWAEMLFFLVAPAIIGGLGFVRFGAHGSWSGLVVGLVCLALCMLMVVIIRRKLSANRSKLPQDENG